MEQDRKQHDKPQDCVQNSHNAGWTGGSENTSYIPPTVTARLGGHGVTPLNGHASVNISFTQFHTERGR